LSVADLLPNAVYNVWDQLLVF